MPSSCSCAIAAGSNELYGPLSLEGQIAVETQGTLPGVDKPL